jgi:hypothetical protein
MASKGANKDIVHLWETQELEKRHVWDCQHEDRATNNRDALQNQQTGGGQTNCQIYCSDAEDEKLDLVEGSTLSETEKEPADTGGTG